MSTRALDEQVDRPPLPQRLLLETPPLENGDRLTRLEFERRYAAMPNLNGAELIEGVVFMPSPVRVKSHGAPHSHIVGWLFNYCAATPGVLVADNVTLRLDLDNEPQPDAVLWLPEAAGGRARIGEDDYLEGSPELIVEVAGSSAAYDLHEKLNAYRRNGVTEYVVWRIYDRQIDWFALEAERYTRISPDADGILQSRGFPGLRLCVPALLGGDLARVLAELQIGLASEGHAAFARRLASALPEAKGN
jgi:Uma2 family endonuclease